MRRTYQKFGIAALTVLCTSGLAQAAWLNETDSPLEADYAVLQFPSSVTAPANTLTQLIYGQLYEAGTTEAGGPAANVVAELGLGPLGSDPRTSGGWNWFATFYNTQSGNNDEYQQQLLTPLFNGMYSYTYRFSLNNGLDWTAADIDGAGSNVGLTFDPQNLGKLTVFGGIDGPIVPEPQGLVIAAMAICGFTAIHLRRRWG